MYHLFIFFIVIIIVVIAIIVIIGVIEFLQYDGSTPIHYTIFGGCASPAFSSVFFPTAICLGCIDYEYGLIRTNE